MASQTISKFVSSIELVSIKSDNDITTVKIKVLGMYLGKETEEFVTLSLDASEQIVGDSTTNQSKTQDKKVFI